MFFNIIFCFTFEPNDLMYDSYEINRTRGLVGEQLCSSIKRMKLLFICILCIKYEKINFKPMNGKKIHCFSTELMLLIFIYFFKNRLLIDVSKETETKFQSNSKLNSIFVKVVKKDSFHLYKQ